MTRKTTAQWRREVPAYDRVIRAAEYLLRQEPRWAAESRVMAHLHPDTRRVSILLRGPGSGSLIPRANEHLSCLGYSIGGWVHETTCGVEVWRKDVTR